MSRDDSALYTGITSASYGRVAQKKTDIRNAKERKRTELTPDAHLVLAEIAKERDSITSKVWGLINVESTEDHVKATLLALKLYEGYLGMLNNKISVILRVKSEPSND